MAPPPTGRFLEQDGDLWYRIDDIDAMPPFFMTLAGDSDLWFFITSRGGLTAGRVDPEGSLFPYETVDRLMSAHLHTGPVTLIRVTAPDGTESLWEPFRDRDPRQPVALRSLARNVPGTQLQFSEERPDLGLRITCRWGSCDPFGIVRTVTLTRTSDMTAGIRLLDGLRRILPAGAPLALYQQASSLVDAYAHAEVDPLTGLGIFALTARISDRPEPEEQLRANVAWCTGLPGAEPHLEAEAIDAFRAGRLGPPETLLTGRRGSYLVHAAFALPPGAGRTWSLVADVDRTQVQVAALRHRLAAGGDSGADIETSLGQATANLRRRVAAADGIQSTGDAMVGPHHFANVLFNIMRGGIPDADYDVAASDFGRYVRTRNRDVARRRVADLQALPPVMPLPELRSRAAATGDMDYARLATDYLPLTFGRRHGDPSRPWNRFSIRLRDADGGRLLWYEGNWRDIFQNWEALALSYPALLPGMVAQFLNASTVDGFNPYRISRDGIDWEVPEEGGAWSNIGYWGDHQIVYLLRLLEAFDRFAPRPLRAMLARPAFATADVPYRLKPYPEIAADPDHTITYDTAWAARIAARVAAIGTDGRLRPGVDGTVEYVTLVEKLLITALARLSNLVVGGGIWMNTQRPEWNDANNALVGNGLSVVTVGYLRRFLVFVRGLLDDGGPAAPVSPEVLAWFAAVRRAFKESRARLDRGSFDDAERGRLAATVGVAFSDYRARVYDAPRAAAEPLEPGEVRAFCDEMLPWLDHTLQGARRSDGLYHAYTLRLPAVAGDALAVKPLAEMLEGQVAALSSGLLGAGEALSLVDALFRSALYRPDQRSFLLYPERRLPGFLERNVVPAASVEGIALLTRLHAAGRADLLERDVTGDYRFPAHLINARRLHAALDALAADPAWDSAVTLDRERVLELYESVFHHREFTGRSGTMYGYEGLGCIYWHMVAKLLLAVQEIGARAVRDGAPAGVIGALADACQNIQDGLGFRKTPAEYGAFPMDPYSHTPAHAGAQQPGMTGQVKEEILIRWGELGLEVEAGCLAFRPWRLSAGEFAAAPHALSTPASGDAARLFLPAGTLAFTVGQVPIVYEAVDGDPWVRVYPATGEPSLRGGDALDANESRAIFERTGMVSRVDAGIPRRRLRPAAAPRRS